jgi:hypothetical protein
MDFFKACPHCIGLGFAQRHDFGAQLGDRARSLRLDQHALARPNVFLLGDDFRHRFAKHIKLKIVGERPVRRLQGGF